MDIYKRLAAAIKQARVANGLSQEELAEQMNVSSTHIKHIESGHRKPSVNILFELAKRLNFSIDEVVFNDTDEKEDTVSKLDSILPLCSDKDRRILYEIATVLIRNK